MKSSQTNQNLAQLRDYYSKIPVLSTRANKQEVKSQMPQKVSQQYSNHLDGKQRQSLKVKNLLMINDDQKLFHNVQESIQSYRSPKNWLKYEQESLDQGNKGQQRMLSPNEYNNMIEYLQRKNEKLVHENKQKEQLINKLLGGCNRSKRIKKNQLPKSLQLLKQIPKSADAKNKMETEIRLPLIKTPEPSLVNLRMEFKNERNELFNIYNMSFGKQINLNEEKNEQLELISNYNKQGNLREKIYSQPNQPLKKNHFQKFLLKLPQEFHLDMDNQKRQL
ncbi:unnamed protein product [Paramecium pentaurelia]|uniref:Uncharacterized protein n=1 Tax=Paramecium pentaurelia TaxID=43138 RepID=A0A8S1X3J6_9CILI|nr:unnamed protein product [Paramecium pentaurelia]